MDTFNSIRSKDYNDIEYIVVDGGSNGETQKLILENQDIISKWVSEPDKVVYDAMNKVISMATGGVVGILNSDDL